MHGQRHQIMRRESAAAHRFVGGWTKPKAPSRGDAGSVARGTMPSVTEECPGVMGGGCSCPEGGPATAGAASLPSMRSPNAGVCTPSASSITMRSPGLMMHFSPAWAGVASNDACCSTDCVADWSFDVTIRVPNHLRARHSTHVPSGTFKQRQRLAALGSVAIHHGGRRLADAFDLCGAFRLCCDLALLPAHILSA